MINHQEFQQNCIPAGSPGQDTAPAVDKKDLGAEEAFAGPGSGAVPCHVQFAGICSVIPDPKGHQQGKLSFAAHSFTSSKKHQIRNGWRAQA